MTSMVATIIQAGVALVRYRCRCRSGFGRRQLAQRLERRAAGAAAAAVPEQRRIGRRRWVKLPLLEPQRPV
jgi:hypothetical protein